ncbi:MAG: hypothetical protein AB7T86_18825, partial [Xanthobacteraceae bacterium]
RPFARTFVRPSGARAAAIPEAVVTPVLGTAHGAPPPAAFGRAFARPLAAFAAEATPALVLAAALPRARLAAPAAGLARTAAASTLALSHESPPPRS